MSTTHLTREYRDLAYSRRAERLAADRGSETLGRLSVHYQQLAPDGATVEACRLRVAEWAESDRGRSAISRWDRWVAHCTRTGQPVK